ncbi:RNA polymerase sigma factor [Actinotalea fermentans]|uniref:ECF RNA polymerase sigma factor SigD n=1 Tax=Actinotalea fermentans TaxID=43671 RepID=A0A511YWJ5_9CELL|nr:sigma-70 family RNA polymerase sigma factor [Actinotalea fermentans]KGM16011.1 hypothetical protein N867_03775 [Actinotalea fermentans ATCC 43279 = JCM 9966 = DSM 3133]GEN79558.1 ECF RNA polymerase sigma factor SigD [Actinotalea fermentans]
MDHSDADLADLVERARAGSPDAFAGVYERLAGPVAGYLRSRGVREVEDATSEVFLAVFTGLARFEGDGERFRAWVFTIAHRRSVDSWRRAGRAPVTEPLDDAPPVLVPSAEDAALDVLGDDRVRALLDLLSPDQRDVLLLRVVADLSLEQVAAVLGKREGAVKALQHRALERLRRHLGGKGVSP